MSECTSDSSVDAVLFDLGNTLVHYYTRAEFTPILRSSVEEVVEHLRRAGWPRPLHLDALERRALELNRERPDHRVWPLEERDPEWDVAGASRAGLTPVLLGDHAVAPPACHTIAKLADVVALVERARR